MATWIAHLRIAENLLATLPGLEAGPFAAGNIAPDSGIPDENWEKFTPPPEVTHFYSQPPEHLQYADLDFYRQYLEPLSGQPVDPAVFSFRLGYFCHLVTDNLWREWIGKPTKEKYKQQFEADPNFIWEVKLDWYGQDFLYVQSNPQSLFWTVFLACQPDTSGLDFLPQEALRQRIEYIQTYYQRQDEEIRQKTSRPMIYLSTQAMDRFVERTSEIMRWSYQRLCVERCPTIGSHSVLAWTNLTAP